MPLLPFFHPPTTRSPLEADAALTVLARHQERRRQGVPTLTVLAAGDDAPARLVRRWAASVERAVGESVSVELGEAVRCWFDVLAESQNVTAAAYAWLAQRTKQDAKALSFGLPARSAHERMLFLDRTLGTTNIAPADIVCRAIVEHACQHGSTRHGLWNHLCDVCAGDLGRLITGVLALVGDERAPMLHIAASTSDVATLATLVSDLASLVSMAPAFPVVVTVTPGRLEEYLAATPECRALALVREGLIWMEPDAELVGWDQRAGERRPTTNDVETGGPALASSLVPPYDASDDDPARSAAERYLFERLQGHPETAGLFELNGLVDGPESGRALEVDLLARSPRVAVEIDGYYHFTDLEAYRRDRRKDMLLQHAGYFVIRCLADDVAGRLEEILDAILAAVRRGRAGE